MAEFMDQCFPPILNPPQSAVLDAQHNSKPIVINGKGSKTRYVFACHTIIE